MQQTTSWPSLRATRSRWAEFAASVVTSLSHLSSRTRQLLLAGACGVQQQQHIRLQRLVGRMSFTAHRDVAHVGVPHERVQS